MICSPSWHFRPDLKTSLFWVSVVLFEYITLHSVIWILTYEKEYLLNMNPISGGDYKAILEKNHSVFCCNTEFDVEGIVKLITVISMHHYALMGLTNGFRIHSKAVYILLRLHYTGRVLLMDWVLISNVIVPSSFCVSSAVRPAHLTHKTHMYTRSPLGLRCLGTAITLSGCFFGSFKRLPDERRPPTFYRERF